MNLGLFMGQFLSLLVASVAIAQTKFLDPQNFGSHLLHERAVAVSTSGIGPTFKELVAGSGTELKFFVNYNNSGFLDRFVDRSRQVFPNQLVPVSGSHEIIELGSSDLNGDGFDDLIIQTVDLSVSPYVYELRVALFDPQAGAYPSATLLYNILAPPLRPGMSSAIVTDVNGDGLKDIVLGHFLSAAVAEVISFVQLSPGVFATAPQVEASFLAPGGLGVFGMTLKVGDLDGDSDQDIGLAVLYASIGVSQTDIYILNQGGVGYTTVPLFTAPADLEADIEIADVDNNGLSDIVFAIQRSTVTSISALFNMGSFWQPQTLVPSFPVSFFVSTSASLYLADIQGDGRTDLLFAMPDLNAISTGNLMIFTQSSTGAFANSTSQFLSNTPPILFEGSSPSALILDFNFDGRVDLLLPSTAGGATLLVGTGSSFDDRTFAHGVQYRSNVTGPRGSVAGRCIGNFNADQFPDIVTIENGKLLLHLADGTGNFTVTSVLPAGSAIEDYCVALDADLDGDTDIFVPGTPNEFLLNNGSGVFLRNTSLLPAGAAVNVGALRAGDINGDGRTDIVMSGYGSSLQSQVLLNIPSGFVRILLPTASNDDVTVIELGDFDGDADIDIAVSNNLVGSGGIAVLELFSNSGGASPNFTRSQLLANIGQIATGDFDGNGLVDLVAAPNSRVTTGLAVTVLYNLGNGSLNGTSVPVQIPGLVTGIAVADFSGDGFADFSLMILTSSMPDTSSVRLMTNNQIGGFFESDTGLYPDYADEPLVLDADGDRDFDLFFISRTVTTDRPKVFLNLNKQFIASAYTSVVVPSAILLELDSMAPGTVGLLLASFDPLSSGTQTPIGLLRLTNFVTSQLIFLSAGTTSYVGINLGANPGVIGQRLNLQVAFFDTSGQIQLSNAQSVLLTG